MKFRKKPVVIEAFKLGTDNIPDWFMDRVSANTIVLNGGHPRDRGSLHSASIGTLEGVMTADRGDYVIRGVKGEIYPCKPDIFAATYEAVDEGTFDPAIGKSEDVSPEIGSATERSSS